MNDENVDRGLILQMIESELTRRDQTQGANLILSQHVWIKLLDEEMRQVTKASAEYDHGGWVKGLVGLAVCAITAIHSYQLAGKNAEKKDF